MIDYTDYIEVNFNFGIMVNLLPGLPKDYLINVDGEKYIVIFREGNAIYDSYYLLPGHYFKHFHKYYLPNLECDVVGLKDDEFIRVFNHKFDIRDKDVLFDLHPRNEDETKVWLSYLQMFETITGCRVHTEHNHEVLYYASYKVSWDEDIWQNPFGVDCTPFDLINNKLLRL